VDLVPDTFLEDAVLNVDVSYSAEEELDAKFLDELNLLASIPRIDITHRKYSDLPTVLRFAYLHSSTSAAVLRFAWRVLPLLCTKIVFHHYESQMKQAKSFLSPIENLCGRISTFI
jgi:hypothetical protein